MHKVTKAELKAKRQKKAPKKTVGSDYREFAETKHDCYTVKKHNIEKVL